MDLLNQQQKSVIEAPLSDMKILGNPGVGKTTTLLYRIQRLHEMGSFLVVVFTTTACTDFISKAFSKGISIISHENVRTLHSLAGTIVSRMHKSSIPLVSDQRTVILRAIRILSKTTRNTIRTRVPILSRLEALYVDEAQDLSEEQYRLVCILKEKLDCRVIMIGDPNQNIFQFQGGSDRFLLDFQAKTYLLNINNRSVPPIVRFANSFRPGNPHLPIMESSRPFHDTTNDDSPVRIYHGNLHELGGSLLHILRNTPSLEDVAIIGPIRYMKEKYNRLALSWAANLLSDHNIPFVIHYPDGNDERIKPMRYGKEKGKVRLCTIHGSKGEEFHTVILLHFHHHAQGFCPTKRQMEELHYLWWTALTRARDSLRIFCLQGQEPWPRLHHVDPSLYRIEGRLFPKSSFSIAEEDERPRILTSITDILHQATNRDLLELETILPCEMVSETSVFDPMRDEEDLLTPIFMGCWIEVLLEYQCIGTDRMVQQWKRSLQEAILITAADAPVFTRLCHRLGIGNRRLTYRVWSILSEDGNHTLSKDEIQVFYRVLLQLKDHHREYVVLQESPVCFHDRDYIQNVLTDMERNKDMLWNLFQVVLYFHQIEYEKRFLWKERHGYRVWVDSFISTFLPRLQLYSRQKTLHRFQTSHFHPNLDITGRCDALEKEGDRILEIKYSVSPSPVASWVYQAFLYHNNLHPGWKNGGEVVLLNARTGKEYLFRCSSPDIPRLLVWLSKISGLRMKQVLLLHSCSETRCPDLLKSMQPLHHLCTLPDGEEMEKLRSSLLRLCRKPCVISHNHDHHHHVGDKRFSVYLDDTEGGVHIQDLYKTVYEKRLPCVSRLSLQKSE